MEIEHVDDETKGAWVVRNPDGDPPNLAEMTYYYKDPGHLVIVHTGVRSQLRGQGMARKLVDAGIAFAKDKGIKVTPQCPYASKVFNENPDLVADIT